MKRLLIALTFIALVTSTVACACWKAENKHRPACVFADNVLDCLKPELMPAVTATAKLIVALILTPLQVPTSEIIGDSLEDLERIVGIDILACAMTKVQDDLTFKVSTTSGDEKLLLGFTSTTRPRMQTGLALVVEWKARKIPASVVIKR